jgi:hypothetical protein
MDIDQQTCFRVLEDDFVVISFIEVSIEGLILRQSTYGGAEMSV